MPQVRQHGFDFPAGRVGSAGRTACSRRPRQGTRWPRSRSPPAKNGDSGIGRGGCRLRAKPPSEKPAVQPPPVQLPATASAEVAAPRIRRRASYRRRVPPQLCRPWSPPLRPAAAAVVPAGFTPFELPEVVAGETFLSSLTRSLWGRVAVLAVSGLLGLAGVLAVWTVVSNRHARYRSEARRRECQGRGCRSAAGRRRCQADVAAGAVQSPLAARANLVVDRPPAVALGEAAAGDELVGVSWSLVATVEPGVIARS